MTDVLPGTAALAALAWLYLLLARDGFWRADQRLPAAPEAPAAWPEVVAVVPARNEEDVVGPAVRSLLSQDYPGRLSVVLVDDDSDDGTAEAARRGAEEASARERLVVEGAGPLPPGWTGKMWAVSRGVSVAEAEAPAARYLWLTDADIEHEPEQLRRLVAKAETEGLDLVSLMVRLHCRGAAERLLIPAFVFFFQKLYPFPAVNDPRRRTAGAAGGCMLVRRGALAGAGGIQAIGGEIIDDCALARRLKQGGPIWLGLTAKSRSLRPYDGLRGIWNMVARAAFAQLHYSPLLLAGTVAGMTILYLAPALAAFWGVALAEAGTFIAGTAGLVLMWTAYRPTYALYGRPGAAFLALPAAAFLYTLMTVDSARRHWRGRGGAWKGRTYSKSTA